MKLRRLTTKLAAWDSEKVIAFKIHLEVGGDRVADGLDLVVRKQGSISGSRQSVWLREKG